MIFGYSLLRFADNERMDDSIDLDCDEALIATIEAIEAERERMRQDVITLDLRGRWRNAMATEACDWTREVRIPQR